MICFSSLLWEKSVVYINTYEYLSKTLKVNYIITDDRQIMTVLYDITTFVC